MKNQEDQLIRRLKNNVRGVKKDTLEFLKSKVVDHQISKEIQREVLNSLGFGEKSFLFNCCSEICKLSLKNRGYFAIANELLMQAAFVSDDVFDQGLIRNDKETIFSKSGSNKAFLISSIMYGLYFSAINEGLALVKGELHYKVLETYCSTYMDLNLGQLKTLETIGVPISDLKKIDELAFLKCGSLMATCCSMPAILTENDSFFLKAFNYGKWIGISLQHRDDILEFIDFEGDTKKLLLQDFFNGQPNLVLTYYFMLHKENKLVKKYFNWYNKEKTINDIPLNDFTDLIEIFYESSSIMKAQNHLKDCCKKALNKLSNDSVQFSELIIFSKDLNKFN